MVITRITGGLGNQLFQYAAGRALAATTGAKLKLDTHWFRRGAQRESHEAFALGPYDANCAIAAPADLSRVQGLGRTWPQRIGAAIQRGALAVRGTRGLIPRRGDGDFSFNPEFFSWSGDVYLDGNWQSERYFAPIADDLRVRLRTYRPDDEQVIALGTEIDSGTSAFVHVRRGDYVSHNHFKREIGALDTGYYNKALGLLKSVGTCRLFVFTNDPEWARQHLPRESRILGPEEVPSAHDVLWLMARCHHAVIANSSLSWWGAWRDWQPGKVVCAPYPWFSDSWRNTRDLLPAAWLQLPRSV